MKTYPYPFEHRKVKKNINRWVKLKPNEAYVCYLDTSFFGRKDQGAVLTSQRVIQFNKENIERAISLRAINSVEFKSNLNEPLVEWRITICSKSSKLPLEFSDTDWIPLKEFVTHLEEATNENYGIRNAGLKPKKAQLYKSAQNPIIQSDLAELVTLHPGEKTLAHHTHRHVTGDNEYVLTNKRLLVYWNSMITWEIDLKDIQSFTIGGFLGDLDIHLRNGDKKSMVTPDTLTSDAYISLIEACQQGKTAMEASPATTKKHEPERSRKAYEYPLTLVMEWRGLMSGFRYNVEDAEKNTVFEVRCKGPVADKMHVAQGDKIVAILSEEEAEKHYIFKAGNGRKLGEIKGAGRTLVGPVKDIFDGKGNKIGTVRKKSGVKAWSSRAYQLFLDETPILEIHCEYQVPWRAGFIINRINKAPRDKENLLLYSAFVLRLIEPSLMDDPVRSTLKKARKGLTGQIEDLL